MRGISTVTRPLAVIVVALISLPSAAQEVTPTAIVERFQGNLIAVMKDAQALGVKGRYQRLAPEINRAFHLPLMAHIATGNYWKRADQAQRDRLVEAFRRMSASILATLFDGYSGEIFETVGEKKGPQDTLLVLTKLLRVDDSAIDITYVAKKIKDRWWIIDVVVEKGISELTVRRSEYRLQLKKAGVDGLIATLNAKADELLAN